MPIGDRMGRLRPSARGEAIPPLPPADGEGDAHQRCGQQGLGDQPRGQRIEAGVERGDHAHLDHGRHQKRSDASRRPAPVPRSPTVSRGRLGPARWRGRRGGGEEGETRPQRPAGPRRRMRPRPRRGRRYPQAESPRRCLRLDSGISTRPATTSTTSSRLRATAAVPGDHSSSVVGDGDPQSELSQGLAPAPLGEHQVVEPDGDHGEHDHAPPPRSGATSHRPLPNRGR